MTDEIRCPVCGQPIIYTGRRGRRRPAILDAQPRAVAPGHASRPTATGSPPPRSSTVTPGTGRTLPTTGPSHPVRAGMTAACGTDAGYQAHRRRREPRCPDCKAAHTRYTDSRRQATADPVAVDRAAAGHPPDPLTTAKHGGHPAATHPWTHPHRDPHGYR